MEIIEAIMKRKSIRDFKPDPISKEVLEKILEISVRSPSGVNKQPWEFAILTGEVLEKIKSGNIEAYESGKKGDYGRGGALDSIYRDRQVNLAKELFRLMDIQREDQEKRAEWLKCGYRYFNAPAAIIILVDEIFPEPGPLMDIGAVIQTLCLAALHYEFGTCITAQGKAYPDVIRKYADIPTSKRMVMAIAIGYPNWDYPANKIETPREPVKNITTWHGFSDPHLPR
ncbi:MAG: nitroreductase [Deltaproteobacteria bacterium]|nr:nitroreductase [Deltaproteobacteria bacterium]